MHAGETADTFAELALKLEPIIAERAKANQRKHGGTAPGKSLRQKSAEVSTREALAKAAGVSHDTIASALREEDAKKNTQQRVAALLGVARETVRDWFKPTTNGGSANGCKSKAPPKPKPDARVKVSAKRKPLSDEAAFMELATSNNQGELSPLEIGIHALRAVPLEKGGRGKKGGLSEYAERVGKGKSAITEYRQAAVVFRNCSHIPTVLLLDKAYHLSAIHSANRPLWPMLVSALLAKGWSVEDAKHHVGQVQEFGKVLADDKAGWRDARTVGWWWNHTTIPLPVCCRNRIVGFSAPRRLHLMPSVRSQHFRLSTHSMNAYWVGVATTAAHVVVPVHRRPHVEGKESKQ